MSRRAVVIIPTLNEAATIATLLGQLSRQPESLVAQILVADGGSSDSTRALVAAAAAGDARIVLIDNPRRIQAAGVNFAVAVADPAADTIVRIDAHSVYPDDYVPRIMAAFAATNATMVAVRLDSRGDGCAQRGIALAGNSRIGSGGSAHRVGGHSGFVDHGHHAGMDRATFTSVGGYDEGFAANEDAELDLRVRRAGGSIWLAGDIEVTYFPRRTLGALARQYWRYGRGRAQTFLKHREKLRLRQMLPPLMVIAVAGALLLAPLAPWLLVVPLLYLLAVGAATLPLLKQYPSFCTLFAAPATAVMHFAWGGGFIATAIRGRRQTDPASGTSIKPAELVRFKGKRQ